MKLKNKVALVTGGGRGIGQAIAVALAEEGADVVVAARSVDQLEEAVQKIEATGGKGIAIPADLSQRETIDSFVQAVSAHYSKIDILVNNAGIGSGANAKLVVDYDDDFWDTSVALNLTAPYLLTKAFVPAMIKAGWGRVINIASVAGIIGGPGRSGYAAAKGGVIALTRSVAAEVGGYGITVNAVAPGYVTTEMSAGLSDEVKDEIRRRLAIRRFGTPEDIAGTVAFLASADADYITGQVIRVDGGIA